MAKIILSILITGFVFLSSCHKEEIAPQLDVYGHAGTSIKEENWIFPPNSKAAIEYGLDVLDADGVELDVQFTKDSVAVLFHDQYLFPAINKEGCIHDYSWSELKGEKIYGTKYSLFQLKDALLFVSKRNKKVLLDVKHFNFCANEILEFGMIKLALQNALQGLDSTDVNKIFLSSRNIDLLKEIDFLAITIYETDNIQEGIQLAADANCSYLSIKLLSATKEQISSVKSSGLGVILYNVETSNDIESALQLKPDGIISDNVALTKKKNNE